tara:strand:+ start:5298 stop:5942 length:645 start_codon:yes stop_codon:yes gene_type:complete
MSNYKKAVQQVFEFGLTVKSLKVFNGREGHGVNANIYLHNKKIAVCIDSGNGGELSYDFLDEVHYKNDDGDYVKYENHGESRKAINTLISTLPTYTYSEWAPSLDWGDRNDKILLPTIENVFNLVINDCIEYKEFKKAIKKVQGLITDSKGKTDLFGFKHKPSQLDTKFNYKGKSQTLEQILTSEHKGIVILNKLTEAEGFRVWKKHFEVEASL